MIVTNFTGAILAHADLRGADLRASVGLTVQQIEQAITDETTQLPDYLKNEYLKIELARVKGQERLKPRWRQPRWRQPR